MATQTIEYLSCTRICCGTFPADVILCVPTPITASGLSTINASLLAERCHQSNCRQSFIYTIEVDEDQLAEDVTLSGSEISGLVCRSCLTEYIDNGDGMSLPLWASWVPTFTASGGMTFSASVAQARFVQYGKTVQFVIQANLTTATIASERISFTPPVVAANTNAGGGVYILDSAQIAGFWIMSATNLIDVKHYDGAAWSEPAAVEFRIAGLYEAA